MVRTMTTASVRRLFHKIRAYVPRWLVSLGVIVVAGALLLRLKEEAPKWHVRIIVNVNESAK